MTGILFDPRSCTLGEGPLWHPERNQLFWFDIIGKKMMSRADKIPLEWQFEHHVSAAGWISRDELLIASEVELFRFNVDTLARSHICPLDAGNSLTRSNDGRADPWGASGLAPWAKMRNRGQGRFTGFIGIVWNGFTRGSALPIQSVFAPAKTAPITQTH